jgi:hypothetical protein
VVAVSSQSKSAQTQQRPMVKNHCFLIASIFKAVFIFFVLIVIDPTNDFCYYKFFAEVLKKEGEWLKLDFGLWK